MQLSSYATSNRSGSTSIKEEADLETANTYQVGGVISPSEGMSV